jgi:hypothetical protein
MEKLAERCLKENKLKRLPHLPWCCALDHLEKPAGEKERKEGGGQCSRRMLNKR